MRSACAGLVALLIGVASESEAQTRQLELRLDSLARVATLARTAVRAYDDSIKRGARTLDTAYTGVVTVVAARPIADQARAIMPALIDSLEAKIGQATAGLAGHTVSAQVEYRVGWRTADTAKEVVVSVLRPNGARLRFWRAPLDSANLEASLRYAITYTAFFAPDPSFFAWAGNGIPRDTTRAPDWANQRLLLVSSASAVADRCYRGDVQACRMALMLTPSSDPILDWHDRSTRRRLVRNNGALARRMDVRAERQCRAGSDAACIAVLRLVAPETFREPAAGALRAGLLNHALAVGGPGAVERLLLSNARDRASRLEAAARMPIDSLISSWQARVRGTRAPSEDLTIGITILSLAWAGGFGALSLRSSRWR